MVADFYESRLEAPPAQDAITWMRDALGGSAAVAREVGVSQRTVQRWVAYERGERDPNRARNPNAKQGQAVRERIQDAKTRAADQALARQIRRDGLTVTHMAGELQVSQSRKQRTIMPHSDDAHISGDALDAFLQAAAAGDWQRAGDAWQEALFDTAYVVPGATWLDMTALDMEIG